MTFILTNKEAQSMYGQILKHIGNRGIQEHIGVQLSRQEGKGIIDMATGTIPC